MSGALTTTTTHRPTLTGISNPLLEVRWGNEQRARTFLPLGRA